MVSAAAGGTLLDVRVLPRAPRSSVAGVRDGALLVRLAAAPVDGEANAALLVLLADALDVPRRAITLVAGERARRKRLRIDGLSPEAVRARLAGTTSVIAADVLDRPRAAGGDLRRPGPARRTRPGSDCRDPPRVDRRMAGPYRRDRAGRRGRPDRPPGRRRGPSSTPAAAPSSPGFVDPHTHVVYAGDRRDELARRLAGATYAEIAAAGGGIVRTVAATRDGQRRRAGRGGAAAAGRGARPGHDDLRGEERLRPRDRRGARACCAPSGSSAASQPVELSPTFMGAHEVPIEYRDRRDDYLRLVIDEMLPAVAAEGLAEWNDVFCEDGVFTPGGVAPRPRGRPPPWPERRASMPTSSAPAADRGSRRRSAPSRPIT